MTKKLFTAIIALCTLSMHAQTKEITQAPINPLFQKFIEKKEQNKLPQQVTAEGKKIGSVIPSVLQPNFDAYLQQQQQLKSALTGSRIKVGDKVLSKQFLQSKEEEFNICNPS